VSSVSKSPDDCFNGETWREEERRRRRRTLGRLERFPPFAPHHPIWASSLLTQDLRRPRICQPGQENPSKRGFPERACSKNLSLSSSSFLETSLLFHEPAGNGEFSSDHDP
jgi:hypothetical protein